MNRKPKNRITYWLKIAVIGIALGLGLQFVRAWTEPTAAPPGGNVGAPINTGANTQWKGMLGDITKMGSLGIWGSLETYGFKMLTDAGAGKVLTSDAAGIGTWQSPSGAVVPAGVISAFGGSAPPAGYLLCDGANNISRATYAALYAVIGTTYGSGTDGNTFKLPDLRQRFPLGKAASGTGSILGGTGGMIDPSHTHSTPNHSHSLAMPSAPYQPFPDSGGPLLPTSTDTSGGGTTGSTATSNPPFQVVNYIIKY